MAKTETPLPDKDAMKKLFSASMKVPVSCAVAKGPNNSVVLYMDKKAKKKKPASLKPLLEAKFGKANVADIRWGTVSINKAEDSKLAILNMNKNLAGCAPKLKKWLKGCGVSKIRYMVDGKVTEEVVTVEPGDENEPELNEADADEDDETEVEDENDNETETVSEDNDNESTEPNQSVEPVEANQSTEPNQSVEPEPAATAAAAETPAAEEQPATPAIDFDALARRLTDLVKRMIPVMQNEPARANELKGLAVAAQTAVKGQDPQAEQAVQAFEQALGNSNNNASANPAPTSNENAPATPASPAAPAMDPAKKAALAASPKIWNDTISVVSSGVSALKEAIRKDFADEAPEVVADIEKNLSRIDQVTARFDKQLADLLEGVNAATDEAARKAGLAKARSVLAEHIKYAASEPLIGMIDQNPFGVSPDIKKTLVANLTQLANAIR